MHGKITDRRLKLTLCNNSSSEAALHGLHTLARPEASTWAIWAL